VGASGAIGSAVVRRLARKETTMGLHCFKNPGSVASLCRDLGIDANRGHIFQADLGSEKACSGLVAECRQALGSLDLLAICHGDVCWKGWRDLEWADWETIFRQHCLAAYTLATHALPSMIAAGFGRIVYLSSIAPKYAGSSRSIHYAAAKGALEIAMRGLAREVARTGVRINGVRAGFVMTPQQRTGRTEEEQEERIAKIPLGRAGKTNEIAAAFEYLMSDDADFITGEIITVAGGD